MTNHVSVIPSLAELLQDAPALAELRACLEQEHVFVIRQAVSPRFIAETLAYLQQIGRGSLPNWQAFTAYCGNFHRINRWDERSYVKGCFHQFSFFPWNQDVLDLFGQFRDLFVLRNLLSGAPPDAYLGPAPFEDCIARLSFQFYPKHEGAMNEHRDPAGPHQAVVPILIMSQLGRDFHQGGVFVRTQDEEVIWVETVAEPGDVVLFNPQMRHGVARIDPDAEPDWLSFQGRWMAIIAVNKLATNTQIADAVDLGTGGQG